MRLLLPAMTVEDPSFCVIAAVTANARYIHASAALRCLTANLGPFSKQTRLLEFTLEDSPSDIVEKILALNPSVVLLSVYIWNTDLLVETASLLRRIRPDIPIAAGGPEVSFSPKSHPIFPYVDRIVTGEGEAVIVGVVEDLVNGNTKGEKVTAALPLDLSTAALPYDLFTDEDIAHRVLYIEASRGCSLGCEFCLSSIDKKVRKFPPKKILDALEALWQRGARRFKFVDRAMHSGISEELLDFFLDKTGEDLFLHFELIPDRLPEPLFERLKAFPKGRVQLEAGLQTLNEDVLKRINRRQDVEKALRVLKRLREETGVHIHSDLVAGLPGESFSSFALGFDRLYALRLHEIQVGILKKLRGAPIVRHDTEWKMLYNERSPYDILQNADIDFSTMQSLKRFSKYFDLIVNRGRFRALIPLLTEGDSPFERFYHLSSCLYDKIGRSRGIALNRLSEFLVQYAILEKGVEKAVAEAALVESVKIAGPNKSEGEHSDASCLPSRQQRHLSGRG
jgi:radical SAM superfamily enzyme YgiQ (UPF0313 family)